MQRPTLLLRLHEREFWIAQAGVAVVTITHLLFEALTHEAIHEGRLAEGLHHIPVALYAVPVAYAGLTYGTEGGLLTGLLAAVLALPAIPLWHTQDYAWIGEILFIGVVIGTGIALAIPVERERRQRRRAEGAVRRLGLVNAITNELARPGALDERVGAALESIVDVLGVAGTWVMVWRREGHGEPFVSTGRPTTGTVAEQLAAAARTEDSGAGDVFVARLQVGEVAGALAVSPSGGSLSADDRSLVSAVAHQLGIAVENALLHRDEQTRLQDYVRAVTRAQEEERKRIARELHDESAQELALLARGIDDLEDRLAASPAEAARAAELRRQARSTLEGIRRYSRDLRPPVLDDFGLTAALERLVAELGERLDVLTEFTVAGQVRRLPTEVELALFRIAQEALRNIEHHAAADRVSVRCDFTRPRVRVEIHDDGRGFVAPRTADLVAAGHLGLMGMYERAQLVGADVRVTSVEGEGTTVLAEAEV